MPSPKNFQLWALWLSDGLPDSHTTFLVWICEAPFPLPYYMINARKQLLILLGQNIAPSQGGFLTPLWLEGVGGEEITLVFYKGMKLKLENKHTEMSFEQGHKGLLGLTWGLRLHITSFCCSLGTLRLQKMLTPPINQWQHYLFSLFRRSSPLPLWLSCSFGSVQTAADILFLRLTKKLGCSTPRLQQKVFKSAKLSFFSFNFLQH